MNLSADVAATLQPGFVGTSVPDWLVRAGRDGLVSVCLYGDNVSDAAGLDPACSSLRDRLPGVLLAVDEEGGDVTRIHRLTGSPSVGNGVLGRLDDTATTRAVASGIGWKLRALGVGLDLAPVVDVNSSPQNPVIGVRSFGSEPDAVARHAAAWVEGLQSAGVAACAKHFPGHGDTVLDSHHDLPRVDAPFDVVLARELPPFRAAVSAGAAAVMTSHIVVEALDPERPATFSPTVLGLLRHELGFDGVVVSDALDMAGASARAGIPEAAVRALEAGVDLLCLGSRTTPQRYAAVHAAVREAVGSGRLARGRVGEAADRVRGLAAAGRAPRTSAPPPDLPLGRVARTFFLSERARRWLAAGGEHVVVQVDSVANPAVGDVPWGPAAVTSTVAETAVPRGARVAVVGRGVGPDHPARRAADRLSTDGHEVVLVDCGWPRGGTDIETFGGSPAVARALLALLRGELRG